MILESFKLNGKIAVVIGCNTGLGKGMALGLAEAGAEIIGVNRSNPAETAGLIKKIGGRFTNISADLWQDLFDTPPPPSCFYPLALGCKRILFFKEQGHVNPKGRALLSLALFHTAQADDIHRRGLGRIFSISWQPRTSLTF